MQGAGHFLLRHRATDDRRGDTLVSFQISSFGFPSDSSRAGTRDDIRISDFSSWKYCDRRMSSSSPDRHLRLLAHNVRSLWNVGSFFRTCDAMGVERIYLTGYTGHPPRKEITKTAIGAEEFVAWEHHVDPVPVVDALRGEGWKIVALEITESAVDLADFPSFDKTCLVVGHELTGVPDAILERADAVIKIPMLGQKESLNVAVAAGIALYWCRHGNICRA